jgi:hypothetical protein
MDYRKALLSAASVLALTAGIQEPASASIPTPERAAKLTDSAKPVPSLASDATFDFVMRTNGNFSADAVENALIDMFSNPSHEQIESLPEFLQAISTLGLAPKAMERAKDTLILVVSASELDESTRHAIENRLESDLKPVKLADSDLKPKEPQSIHGQGAFHSAAGGSYQGH